MFLLSYLFIFIFRFCLVRFSFLTIFFSIDNMSAAAFIIFIRPAAGQTIIDNDKILFSLFKNCKLFLNGYKIDKTVPRKRRD